MSVVPTPTGRMLNSVLPSSAVSYGAGGGAFVVLSLEFSGSSRAPDVAAREPRVPRRRRPFDAFGESLFVRVAKRSYFCFIPRTRVEKHELDVTVPHVKPRTGRAGFDQERPFGLRPLRSVLELDPIASPMRREPVNLEQRPSGAQIPLRLEVIERHRREEPLRNGSFVRHHRGRRRAVFRRQVQVRVQCEAPGSANVRRGELARAHQASAELSAGGGAPSNVIVARSVAPPRGSA